MDDHGLDHDFCETEPLCLACRWGKELTDALVAELIEEEKNG